MVTQTLAHGPAAASKLYHIAKPEASAWCLSLNTAILSITFRDTYIAIMNDFKKIDYMTFSHIFLNSHAVD